VRSARPRERLSRVLAASVVASAIASCGRVGNPRPPQYVIPRSPESVSVRNVAAGFELTFPRPREYVDGVALDDLGSFELWRSCEPDPGFVQIADVPVLDRDRFQKQRSFTLTDFDVRVGQVCVYRVVAVTLDDYRSPPADSAPIRREMPPPEPSPTSR